MRPPARWRSFYFKPILHFPNQVRDVCFSNRPFGVKRFQTIHHCSVDVAHGLVLLFGIGTKALPSWDPRTRRNNLLDGLAVSRTAGPSDMRTHLIRRPARDIFHRSVELECSPIELILILRLFMPLQRLLPGPAELGAVNPYAVHDHGQSAGQRHDRLLHPATPGDCIAQALSHDHFLERIIL